MGRAIGNTYFLALYAGSKFTRSNENNETAVEGHGRRQYQCGKSIFETSQATLYLQANAFRV